MSSEFGRESFTETLEKMGVVNPKDRDQLALRVASVDLKTHKGIASLASIMISGLVARSIPPAVAEEARHWAELMLTANLTKRSLDGGGSSSVEVLLESRLEVERALDVSYTTPPRKLVLDGKS